ncbi:MAG TPA: outer membrane protein assembly factor BamD, partial [bacterium]|nr:outer membrane protein assembly factor BamD [bacterium]
MLTNKSLFRIYFFLFTMLLSFFIASGEETGEQDDVDKAYKIAYKYILDEQWDNALKAFKKLIQDYPQSKWVDDSHFWQCFAREKKGEDLESVFKCYESFITKYRSSKWVDDARTNMIRIGQQLAKSGKPEY